MGLANLSTEQIFLALLKESAYTPRTIIYSDAGSNFTPLNTNFTEFTTNEKILQSLPPHWRRLLKKNEDLVKNPDPHLNFVTFAKGNHKAVGEVEFQVGKIKHLCRSIRLWSKLIRGHFTFLEVQVLLTQLQACLNSAPLYFNRGVLYTKDVIYKASRGLPDDNLDTNSHNLYELYCEGTNSLTRPLSYKETIGRKKVTQTAEKNEGMPRRYVHTTRNRKSRVLPKRHTHRKKQSQYKLPSILHGKHRRHSVLPTDSIQERKNKKRNIQNCMDIRKLKPMPPLPTPL